MRIHPTEEELRLLKEAKESLGWIWIDGDKGDVYLRNECFEMGIGPLNKKIGEIRPKIFESYKGSISPKIRIHYETISKLEEKTKDFCYSNNCKEVK